MKVELLSTDEKYEYGVFCQTGYARLEFNRRGEFGDVHDTQVASVKFQGKLTFVAQQKGNYYPWVFISNVKKEK